MTICSEQPIAEPRTGRVPDFFIVGSAKSGTTALYGMLRGHPQIYMPDNKEPWFLASELHVRTPRRPEGTPNTLEQYLSLFAPADPQQRAGEASALYLWSHSAADAIAAVQPAARIIAILREPASFLRSLHMQFLVSYVETETSFRKAIDLEEARREGRSIPKHSYWPLALCYSDHVRYVEQLRRYHAAFPPEQVLVLIYDDFRRDNEATVRKVFRFLDVDPDQPVHEVEANPSMQVRSPRLHGLIHALKVGRGPVSLTAKEAIKTLTPRQLRHGVLRASKRRATSSELSPPDEEFMMELRRRFKPEVQALSDYIDRDLVTLWGYDHIN